MTGANNAAGLMNLINSPKDDASSDRQIHDLKLQSSGGLELKPSKRAMKKNMTLDWVAIKQKTIRKLNEQDTQAVRESEELI